MFSKIGWEMEKESKMREKHGRCGRFGRSTLVTTQSAITCSKLTIGTLEQGVKYVQS